MNDYQRGLLRAAEICEEYAHGGVCAEAIRAEAEKNADRRAGRETLPAPSQEGHAAGPACSAPDEALIEEIAEETFKRWYDREFNQAEATKWAIREYIRRSTPKATHESEEPDDFMEEGDGSWCHDSDMGAR